MDKRFLVYSNTGLTSKQVGLTAEIVEQLRINNENAEIKFVLCDNVLENCYFNRVHNVAGCISCQSRLTDLLQLAGMNKTDFILLKQFAEANSITIPDFNNLDELLDYSYKGFNVGRGVASSIISYKRDYHINSEKYGSLINIELQKAVNVLLNFQNILDDFDPDEIYLFNGRFAEVHPLIELARDKQIPFYSMEAGSGSNYELFKNHLPHSIKGREQTILEIWNSGDRDKEQKAKDWFVSKRKGADTYEKSFIQNQIKNKRPDNFDETKTNIAIFNSSEDEMKVMEEWQTPLFKYQNQAIEQIATYFSNNKNIHFYLRVHPNLGEVKNIQMDEINQMRFENVTVIPPDSPIDTYSLMDVCDKIITFGSSVGIEATFWGKPSILYGRCFYVNLDVAYVPQSFLEACALIEKNNLSPKNQYNTLCYGYYLSEYGKKTEYFNFNGLKGSTYKSHKIKTFSLSSIKYLRYFKKYRFWKQLHRIYYNEPFSLSSIKKYK
jgi:hypothetical protein